MQFQGGKGLSGEGSKAAGNFGEAEIIAEQSRKKRTKRRWEPDRGQESNPCSSLINEGPLSRTSSIYLTCERLSLQLAQRMYELF